MISICKGSNPFTPAMNYYNKILVKKKLINFWTFSGANFKNIFLLNYKFIFCFYKKVAFFNSIQFLLIIKKILPVLNCVVATNHKILFIGSNSLYCQSIYSKNINFIGKLKMSIIGVFTNFTAEGFKFFDNFKFRKKPSLIMVMSSFNGNYIFLDAKKKNIPIIAFIDSDVNSSLVDYPISINSSYFYNVYIFSRFFFKYVLKLI